MASTRVVPLMALVVLAACACSSTASSVATAPPTPAAMATATAVSPPASASGDPQVTGELPSIDDIPTLQAGTHALKAGTYRVALDTIGYTTGQFPAARITVPFGWTSIKDGAFLNTAEEEGRDRSFVALQFWDVTQIYRDPCRWTGTLFDPGPTVSDLVTALATRPMRHATDPVDVSLDGYRGTYLEWSVPSDLDFEQCDAEDGTHYFESWAGSAAGHADGDRYQQAPGQVDRLWILDVGGHRLVIDAFSLPGANDFELAQVDTVVQSLRFDR